VFRFAQGEGFKKANFLLAILWNLEIEAERTPTLRLFWFEGAALKF
jgi:hypothetical protein